MTCIDWPCCGHEYGCCPSFDDDGKQTNMRCTCGKILPVTSRYSLCDACLNDSDESDDPYAEAWEDEDEPQYFDDEGSYDDEPVGDY